MRTVATYSDVLLARLRLVNGLPTDPRGPGRPTNPDAPGRSVGSADSHRLFDPPVVEQRCAFGFFVSEHLWAVVNSGPWPSLRQSMAAADGAWNKPLSVPVRCNGYRSEYGLR